MSCRSTREKHKALREMVEEKRRETESQNRLAMAAARTKAATRDAERLTWLASILAGGR